MLFPFDSHTSVCTDCSAVFHRYGTHWGRPPLAGPTDATLGGIGGTWAALGPVQWGDQHCPLPTGTATTTTPPPAPSAPGSACASNPSSRTPAPRQTPKEGVGVQPHGHPLPATGPWDRHMQPHGHLGSGVAPGAARQQGPSACGAAALGPDFEGGWRGRCRTPASRRQGCRQGRTGVRCSAACSRTAWASVPAEPEPWALLGRATALELSRGAPPKHLSPSLGAGGGAPQHTTGITLLIFGENTRFPPPPHHGHPGYRGRAPGGGRAGRCVGPPPGLL